MADLDEIQKKLKVIADVVNAFKSESVQLRVVEALLRQLDIAPATPLPSGADDTPSKRPRRRKGSARQNSKPEQSQSSQGASGRTAKAGKVAKKARASGSPGGYAMVTQLVDDGFFRKPQTISGITNHCSTSKGHHYKANEISPGLLRLLRDGKLKRQKNKDGQYEYTQA